MIATSATGPEPLGAAPGADASGTAAKPPGYRNGAVQTGSLPAANDVQMEALDTVAYPVLAVLSNGHLVFANVAAQVALKQHRWLRHHNGRIDAASHTRDPCAVREALAEIHRGRPSTVVLVDSATGAETILATVPISHKDAFGTPVGFIWLIPGTAPVRPFTQLARMFDLTIAEQRVLEQLVASEDMREAARKLHISLHTVRNHLKMIFHKTGRRTQGQVLAFANRMISIRFPEGRCSEEKRVLSNDSFRSCAERFVSTG